MRIIIDFRPLLYNCLPEEATRFVINSLNIVFRENPENEWIFLGDELYTPETLHTLEEQRSPVKKILPGPLGWKLWYDWQIPRIIKRHPAELFIATGGVATAAPIPQCVWIPPDTKKNKNHALFYKKRLQSTLQKAQTLFVFSEEHKNKILQQYPVHADKLSVIHSAPDEGRGPLSWTEKENVKIKYAAGKEYFAVAGSAGHEQVIAVLKAFSHFKKRQQSNMQLLMTVKGLGEDIDFLDKLESYKYRADVHTYGYLSEEEMTSIFSASYALLYAAEEGDPGAVVLNAFTANVPVITNDGGCSREITADAVLYTDMNNPESLSAQLMLLYTDEIQRNQLMELGKQQASLFTRAETGTKLWQGILKAVHN